MKIILIGFMGSGKSSVAHEISLCLKSPVIEMDDLVYLRTNSGDMHEVFDKGGEQLLRETELEIARQHPFPDHCIISTGGGVILNAMILDYLRQPKGTIYFLNASFSIIRQRLSLDSSRPLFKNITHAESLYHFRRPLYLRHADHVIDVDHKCVQDIALEIVNKQTATIS